MQQTLTKSEVFARELDYIKDEKIKASARRVVDLLPDYYFHEPASSTGKYHPKFSLGEGGLIRHVKVAVRIAQELFTIYKFDDETKDLITFALIIHDGIKKGLDGKEMMAFDHPILIGKFLKDHKNELELSDEQLERIVKMDASHMGKWNTNSYNPGVVLPLPKSVEEKFVHMCDYISSRKFINVSFDDDDNIVE
ncbi:MAG TPA: hypothetical protein DCY94_00910 [Firmicutes bacterium]|nr:hypothetical protein [Bacillota bacterium]